MIELVVFDMAGTTIKDNHEVEACFAKAAFESGLSVSPERILALQGYSKMEVFRMLWTEANPTLPDYEMKIKIEKSYRTFCQILESHYLNNEIKATLGCLDLFKFLKANNIKIALTTGFYRKVTDIILEKLGWLAGLNEHYIGSAQSIIDVSVASDEVLNGRPKPDMILKAMNLLDVRDLKKVIVIGDTPSDLLAGAAAEVYKTFGVTNGTHSEIQLKTTPHDRLFESMSAFKTYLQKTFLNSH